MAKYKIQEVGTAAIHTSKKGNKTLKLSLYKWVFEKIAKNDFEDGMYIMLDSGKIICPMPYEL